MRSYNEWKNSQGKQILVSCRDNDGTLEELLRYIKSIGNTGHSFTILVDPAEKGGKKFFWDGDGSDYIRDVRVIKPGLHLAFDTEGEPREVE